MHTGTSPHPMGIREKLHEKRGLGLLVAGAFVVLAASIVIYTYWPEKKPNLLQAFYSDDDGQTWFADSVYRVAPFDHNGKTAVAAQIYTYDDGKKQFCGYLSQFTPDAKARLEAALADAKKRGAAPGSVGLYMDRDFMNRSIAGEIAGPESSLAE